MPVSEDVPLTAFALELKHALSAIGKPRPQCPQAWPDGASSPAPWVLPGSSDMAASVALTGKPWGAGEGREPRPSRGPAPGLSLPGACTSCSAVGGAWPLPGQALGCSQEAGAAVPSS